MAQSKYPYIEFSGALQSRTTPHIRKTNEVVQAWNANFTTVIGAFQRRLGSQKHDSGTYASLPTDPIDKPALGGFVARYSTGPELWMASNVSGDATSNLRRWDPIGLDWADVETGMLASSEVNFMYDLDEVWVASYVKSTDTVGQSFTVDDTHDVSTTRQLNFAPNARFFIEFNGFVYAANVQIGATRYRDRLYQSSGPTGIISAARGAQTDVPAAVTLFDNVPVMTSDSAPSGTVTASSEASGFEGWHAFDDNITGTDEWSTNAVTTGTLQYDFGSGITKTVTYYSMVACALAETSLNMAPKTWTIEGSNNGSTWTVLDTQTNAATWTAGEQRNFVISNTTAYRYYRINVSANQGGSNVLIADLQLQSSTTGVKALTLEINSARYIKPTQVLEVYTAGSDNLLFDITVLDVDKINDAITFLPYQLDFATGDVSTSTDVITLSDATSFPTNTPIRFTSTGTLPAPLVEDQTYYSIFASGTTIKVSNTIDGSAIDLTSAGSGTHTILISYLIGNQDELWAVGRKNMVTRFWNTDYRNPTSADWLKLPATLDGTNDITGVGSIASRMFIFTENSMTKFDGQNITPLYNDVGCVSNNTICYYSGYIVWLDAKGQVWARNETAGTQDIISLPINKVMQLVPQSVLPGATAVCVGSILKMTLGQVTIGQLTRTLRIIYDFEANTWTTEWFNVEMPVQLEYTFNNVIRPHFFDEHGNFWVDEEGNDDAGTTIPLDVEIGDDNLQVDEIKSFYGIKVYGKNCVTTKILVSIDRGDWIDIGEMNKNIDSIAYPKDLPSGTMINHRFTNSSTGDPAQIEKVVVYYSSEQDTFRAARRN